MRPHIRRLHGFQLLPRNQSRRTFQIGNRTGLLFQRGKLCRQYTQPQSVMCRRICGRFKIRRRRHLAELRQQIQISGILYRLLRRLGLNQRAQ